jgi:molybdopterin-guanine dinucleotide biosynthesis protein A
LNAFKKNPGWRNHITPCILAGGKSLRMGRNKSFVQLGEQALIEIIVEKLTGIFISRPVIITNQPEDYTYLGCAMIGDIIKDKGPLGGIHAGLTSAPTPYIFVFTCDMPFVDDTFVCYMLNRLKHEDILIPRHEECVEPLHAIYSKRCLPAIEAQLCADQRRVQSFFKDVTVTYVSQAEMKELKLAEQYFLNVNTAADLAKAEGYLLRNGSHRKS